MEREIIATGKTVEEAIESACEQLGIAREDAQWEILDLPKRSLLGLRSTPARVKVTHALTKVQCAQDYLEAVLAGMGLAATKITATEREDGVTFTLEGEGLGVIIGRRGETLDALQYLTGLAANKMGGDYFRVTIDSGNYRQKRETTLTDLAVRLARGAVRSGRSSTLEPMNPYERRIIHSAVQTVEGASSASFGDEPNRRVVISSKEAPKREFAPRRPAGRGNYGDRKPRGDRPFNGERKQGGDSKPYGERKPYNNDSKPYGERKPYGDRKPYGERKPYGDRKPPYGDRNAAPAPSQQPKPVPSRDVEDKPLYSKIELE